MTLNTAVLVGAVEDHAKRSGLFQAVNGHEPQAAPSRVGLSAAVWADYVGPAVGGSGLASTSALVRLSVRVYTSALSEPQDAIDPAVLDAVDALCGAYSGDFTLGGVVRSVDLLGHYGQPLSAQAGWLTQDGKPYRVVTITLPVIINDLWTQEP